MDKPTIHLKNKEPSQAIEHQEKFERLPFKELLKSIGPGIILAGIAIGPGSMTTAAMIGSEFEYRMLWLFFPIAFMGISFILSSYHISLLTGMPILQAIRNYYGSFAAKFVGVSLFISCTFFTIGNITGTGAGLNLIFGINWKIGASIMIIFLLIIYFSKGVYNKVEAGIGLCLLGMAIAFIVTFIGTGGPDWKDVGTGFTNWSVPVGSLFTAIGFLGSSANITTGVYGTYLAKEKGWEKKDLFNGAIMADTIASVIGVIFISGLIMMVGAIVLHPTGTIIEGPAQLADMIAPIMGSRVASIVMGIALLSAAFAALMGNTTRSVVLLNAGLNRPTNFEDKSIRYTSLAVIIGSAIIAFRYGGSPTQLILISNVLTNIATPIAGFYMCRMILRNDIFEGYKKPRLLQVSLIISYIVYLIFTVSALYEKVPSLINVFLK